MIRVCGLDEVGRGAFAGPLVATAVVVRGRLEGLFENSPVPIRDSKTLSHSQRQRIATYLIKKGVRSAVETISAREINEKGMAWANREIFIRLMTKLKATKYVVDGNLALHPPGERGLHLAGVPRIIESRVKADRKVPQVILASILAKLHRDKIMRRLDKEFPVYLWKNNKGYGTKQHQEAINANGSTPYHRHRWLATWQKRKSSNP